MPVTSGLIYAWHLNGAGGGRPLSWDDVQAALPAGTAEQPVWIHLHQTDPAMRDWVQTVAALDSLAVESLFAEETRPRVMEVDDGILLNLRGVNLNPDSRPEDMVSVRLWITAERIISVRIRRLMAVEDIDTALRSGKGPCSTSALIADLAKGLGKRVQPVLSRYKEQCEMLEEQTVSAASAPVRAELAALRHDIITISRYLRPQVSALTALLDDPPQWFIEGEKVAAANDRFQRQIEDLDALNDRTRVIQDEIASALAERMSRTNYLLSIVAGIFLPLSFLTGLLGINVGGLPLADNRWGFTIVCIALATIAVTAVVLFRWRKWL